MISYILIALVDAKVKHFIDIAKKKQLFLVLYFRFYL